MSHTCYHIWLILSQELQFNRHKTTDINEYLYVFFSIVTVSIGTIDILSRSLTVFSTNHNRFREAQGQSLLPVMENGSVSGVVSALDNRNVYDNWNNYCRPMVLGCSGIPCSCACLLMLLG